MKRCLLLLVLIGILSPPLLAQTTANGSIRGLVHNPGANQQFSPQFGEFMSRQPPRSAQVMFRFIF